MCLGGCMHYLNRLDSTFFGLIFYRVYRQLIGNKPILESLLLKISESGISDNPDQNSGNSSSSSSSNTNHVNQWIQQLAQKYCGDCKSSFEELSKIIQKVMATRRELVAFDKKKYSTDLTTMSSSVQAPGKYLAQWGRKFKK